MEMEEDDANYSAIPAAESQNNANESARPPLPPERKNEYSVIGPPEPTANNSPYYLSLQNNYDCNVVNLQA